MQTLKLNTCLQGDLYTIIGVKEQGEFENSYSATVRGSDLRVVIKEFFMKDVCDHDEKNNNVYVINRDFLNSFQEYKEIFLRESINLKPDGEMGLYRDNHPKPTKDNIELYGELPKEERVLNIFEENNTVYYVLWDDDTLFDNYDKNGRRKKSLSFINRINILAFVLVLLLIGIYWFFSKTNQYKSEELIERPIVEANSEEPIDENNSEELIENSIMETQSDETLESDEPSNEIDVEQGKAAVNVNEDRIYHRVEKQASFPGGQSAMSDYIKNNIHYPVDCEMTRKYARVVLSFVVDKDGSIYNIKVIRGVNEYLDAEAVRVVKSMPKWVPAEISGVKVRSACRIPVKFRF